MEQARHLVQYQGRLIRRPHFNQFAPADTLDLKIATLDEHGQTSQLSRIVEIAGVHGGGFRGAVLTLKDESFVIKTTLPLSAWHQLWRVVNWGFTDLPARFSEVHTQLDLVTAKLIHDALPVVSQGKFYAPDVYGYTKLPTGYALLVERLSGRPPRFDRKEINEGLDFKQALWEFTRVGYRLGIEAVSQGHVNNPAAMSNLWAEEVDGNIQRWDIFDTAPAIPLRGFIWPLYYFNFHKEIKQQLYSPDKWKRVTPFNVIHIDMFKEEISRFRNEFDPDTYRRMINYLSLYQELEQESQKRDNQPKTRPAEVVKAILGSTEQFASWGLGRFDNWLITPIKITFNPRFRKRFILEGVERAYQSNLITEDQFRDCQNILDFNHLPSSEIRKRVAVMLSLFAIYQGQGFFIQKPIELATYKYLFNSSNSLYEAGVKIFGAAVGIRLVAGLLRGIETSTTGLLTRTNLQVASRVSMLPIVGDLYAVPAQLGAEIGSQGELIAHCTARKIATALSQANPFYPFGGLGSELEAKCWTLVGRRLERLIGTSESTSGQHFLRGIGSKLLCKSYSYQELLPIISYWLMNK